MGGEEEGKEKGEWEGREEEGKGREGEGEGKGAGGGGVGSITSNVFMPRNTQAVQIGHKPRFPCPPPP